MTQDEAARPSVRQHLTKRAGSCAVSPRGASAQHRRLSMLSWRRAATAAEGSPEPDRQGVTQRYSRMGFARDSPARREGERRWVLAPNAWGHSPHDRTSVPRPPREAGRSAPLLPATSHQTSGWPGVGTPQRRQRSRRAIHSRGEPSATWIRSGDSDPSASRRAGVPEAHRRSPPRVPESLGEPAYRKRRSSTPRREKREPRDSGLWASGEPPER